MGSGVSKGLNWLPEEALTSPLSTFRYIEKLCSEGYFISHASDYEVAVRESIRMSQLDLLEILLVFGNAKQLEHYPLNTAVQHGQLEVLELLVSAGFDVAHTSNGPQQGMTPLHVAANTRTNQNVASCGAYLACRGGVRLAKFRTADGYTAFHLAALRGNLTFLEHVLPCYAASEIVQLLMMPSREGTLARALAVEKGHHEVTAIMDAYMYVDAGPQGGGAIPGSSRQSTGLVNEARMMAVWETFFENAMKRMLAQEQAAMGGAFLIDENGKTNAIEAGVSVSSGTPNHSKRNVNSRPRKSADRRNNALDWSIDSDLGTLTDDEPAVPGARYKAVRAVEQPRVSPSRKHKSTQDARVVEGVLRKLVKHWFSNILVHCGTDEIDGYYFLDRAGTSGSVWLQQWLYDTYNNFQQLSVQPSPTLSQMKELTSARLPRMVADAVRLGWVSYYDRTSNTCMWLNVHTWSVAWDLPLGGDPLLSLTGLSGAEQEIHGNATEDISADQSIAENWVMVVSERRHDSDAKEMSLSSEFGEINLDGHGGSHSEGKEIWNDAWSTSAQKEEEEPYYYNRITGDVSHYTPPNYDEINRRRGGWSLVCSAESEWTYYWYHEETGESVWVELQ